MDLDETFRTLMVVGFFALFRIGLYYRLKSQRPRERLDRRHRGVFILATLRPLGPIYWAGMIAYMINPASRAFDSAAVLAVATSMMMANWFVLLAGMLVFLLLAVRSRTVASGSRFWGRGRSSGAVCGCTRCGTS